ncbi:DUF3343 domain-containing protein [Loigolactobacillus coryniformis]|uniref:DUF3343 domain-containing protein n=1 Tax=Loigolactobacillus coryniformis TaxID=1610 RepID=UPI002340BAFE|nr:DUF3343 domain-containing protein [Loigolactobacillus coryniformis]MDC4185776.1 DUF3343 domain-containing protein [Loigolactobacillus coryniformis]
MEYLFTFVNTYAAIKAQDLLTTQTIPFNVMPLPSSLGDSCGICFRIKAPDLTTVRQALQAKRVAITQIYQINVVAGKKRYQPWN